MKKKNVKKKDAKVKKPCNKAGGFIGRPQAEEMRGYIRVMH
jgi:hypothetical protein